MKDKKQEEGLDGASPNQTASRKEEGHPRTNPKLSAACPDPLVISSAPASPSPVPSPRQEVINQHKLCMSACVRSHSPKALHGFSLCTPPTAPPYLDPPPKPSLSEPFICHVF